MNLSILLLLLLPSYSMLLLLPSVELWWEQATKARVGRFTALSGWFEWLVRPKTISVEWQIRAWHTAERRLKPCSGQKRAKKKMRNRESSECPNLMSLREFLIMILFSMRTRSRREKVVVLVIFTLERWMLCNLYTPPREREGFG